MPKATYASLSDVRAAIREGRKIRFLFENALFEAEPFMVDTAPRTGALLVICYVTDSPDQSTHGWRRIPYSLMRCLVVLDRESRARSIESFGRIPRLG